MKELGQKDLISMIIDLDQYLIKDSFSGWDPYDTILSKRIPFRKLGRWFSVLATQAQKRNPINIRNLIGVPKGINPKAMGLFLHAYSILYKKTNERRFLERAHYFYHWLVEHPSKGYQGISWGYNFPWVSPLKSLEAYTPSSVVTGFIVRAMIEYLPISQEKQNVKNTILGASQFVYHELKRTRFSQGLAISYTPIKRDVCYNASLLAAEILAFSCQLNQVKEFEEIAIKSVEFVISRQFSNGRWNYSYDLTKEIEREQVDFHQGYILESIYNIRQCLKVKDKRWEEAIEKGIKFYLGQQFHKSGWGYRRLPRKYPVDIHNQSQGIITSKRLVNYHDDGLVYHNRILEWTLLNMYDQRGYFYYQKHRLYTIRIPYVRWNNAWMMLALSTSL